MNAPRRTRRPATDARTAIAYLRVSTDRQELGPEAQRAAIEAWAAREGVAVVAWHTDSGVSGTAEITDRPALVAALADLGAHRAGMLVVAKRDRIARDSFVAGMIERAAAKLGARVQSADGCANGDGAADAFMRSILDAAAAYERSLIAMRTAAALKAKRARGERAGNVPFGYTADAAGKLSTHEAERAVISQVRDLRVAGLSVRAVVAELARHGVVGRTGKPLDVRQVHNIMKAAAA